MGITKPSQKTDCPTCGHPHEYGYAISGGRVNLVLGRGPFTVVLCPVSDAFLTEDAPDAYVDPYDGLVEGILAMTDGEIATLDDLEEGDSA